MSAGGTGLFKLGNLGKINAEGLCELSFFIAGSTGLLRLAEGNPFRAKGLGGMPFLCF